MTSLITSTFDRLTTAVSNKVAQLHHPEDIRGNGPSLKGPAVHYIHVHVAEDYFKTSVFCMSCNPFFFFFFFF